MVYGMTHCMVSSDDDVDVVGRPKRDAYTYISVPFYIRLYEGDRWTHLTLWLGGVLLHRGLNESITNQRLPFFAVNNTELDRPFRVTGEERLQLSIASNHHQYNTGSIENLGVLHMVR
jgi:hypothetical protein